MRQLTIDLMLNHEKLIAHIANSFGETTGFDVDELISFGREELVKHAKKWDPARGKFTTFLYWLLRSSFTDYIHKQRKEMFVDIYEDSIEAPPSSFEFPARLNELLDNLSGDAKEMVYLSLQSRWNENWHDLPGQLKKLMTRQGWTDDRFALAYNEVQQLVKVW